MSAVNIYLDNERILCATDTLAYANGEAVALVRKKCTIYYGGMFAIAARGRTLVCDIIEDAACEFITVDELLKELPHVVGALSDDLFCTHGGTGVQVYAMGISQSEGQPVAALIARERGSGVSVHRLAPGYHFAPEIDKPGGNISSRLPRPATPEIMKRVCMAQWKIQRELNIGLCIGGAIHMTEIVGTEITRRVIGIYPDYAQHKCRFGDPAAEEVDEYIAQLREQQEVAA